MPGKCTVIYVMSDVRSGSTLLENILSKSDELVSVGEMALLKNHILRVGPGEKWNWHCSCGNAILAALSGPVHWTTLPVNSDTFTTAIQWNFRSKKLLAGSLFSSVFSKKLKQLNNRSYNQKTVHNNFKIYRNIFSHSGKQFIVDSSKDPVQAYITYVNKPADIDVKILYLKRDLRAIAASKRKWGIVNNKKNKIAGEAADQFHVL